MKKVFNKFTIIVLFTIAHFNYSFSQCVMCKNSIESSSNNATFASGINLGILFLLPLPLVIVGLISLYYFKNKKNN